VLALRRTRPGYPDVIAVFNLSAEAVTFDLPAALPAADLSGHGLAGMREGARISMPGYGAWFGSLG
jgi:alpha-glucosidase